MKDWGAERLSVAAGAELVSASADSATAGPSGVSIDSRSVRSGDLFVGLPGQRADGGTFAAAALAAGAWGVLVAPAHATRARLADTRGTVLMSADPLRALQSLAHAWREELGRAGARVVAITGSTGKTSTKDILAALLRDRVRVSASAGNLNTDVGMPLAILAAPIGTDVLVLEMAMRGPGQIAELTAIARPHVGVIVNIGPAHLQQLGSLEAIAAAKAELIAGLGPAATLVIPAGEPLLAPHLRPELETITFGPQGDVWLQERDGVSPVKPGDATVVVVRGEERIELQPSFKQRHNLSNLLAAVAAAGALGVTPAGRVDVSFSEMRGQCLELPGGVVVIDDCYNANPMSVRAAIDDLAKAARARRVAVLGDMLELGPEAASLHREIGAHAAARGVELLITIGPLAAEMGASFAGEIHAVADTSAAAAQLAVSLREGDTVLVKGSRGVGLERVVASLRSWEPGARGGAAKDLAPAAGSGRS